MIAPQLNFYHRTGCHLCEEMAARLLLGWPQLRERLRWRDVDENVAERERYGLDVPVLTWGSIELCRHFLDVRAISDHFGPPRFPV